MLSKSQSLKSHSSLLATFAWAWPMFSKYFSWCNHRRCFKPSALIQRAPEEKDRRWVSGVSSDHLCCQWLLSTPHHLLHHQQQPEQLLPEQLITDLPGDNTVNHAAQTTLSVWRHCPGEKWTKLSEQWCVIKIRNYQTREDCGQGKFLTKRNLLILQNNHSIENKAI